MFRAPAFRFLLPFVIVFAGCGEQDSDPDKPSVKPMKPNTEITLEAVRLEASKPKMPKDILPYDEALAWHEYEVTQVISGKVLSKLIRVAHWTVLNGAAVAQSSQKGELCQLKLVPFESIEELEDVAASDDLALVAEEPPRFLDVSRPLTAEQTPESLRFDYRGHISEQMRLYWRLRGQLRLVVMGNSHATKGIRAGDLLGPENQQTPQALNLAPAGANLPFQCLMLDEYAHPLPQLEWVVWMVSTRLFNEQRADRRKWDQFVNSPGYLHDQEHKAEFWPMAAQTRLVDLAGLQDLDLDVVDFWGWEGRDNDKLPDDEAALRAMVLDACRHVDFAWDEAAFSKMAETAAAFARQGVKVLLLTPPMHPLTSESEASDPDRSSHEAARELVKRLEQLAGATPNLWFRDFHQGGRHDFPQKNFYDVDHVDSDGARQLTGKLRAWMEDCEKEPR